MRARLCIPFVTRLKSHSFTDALVDSPSLIMLMPWFPNHDLSNMCLVFNNKSFILQLILLLVNAFTAGMKLNNPKKRIIINLLLLVAFIFTI